MLNTKHHFNALIGIGLLFASSHAAASSNPIASTSPLPPLRGTWSFAGSTDAVVEALGSYSSVVESSAVPTAVYDISARVVVMPDGARLEAHSGLGERVDNPRFVRHHMRGATPPALYDLRPRESLFHGVAALRLLPLDSDVFGRTGLLAHTYMLHGRPESNGCVVFRDYSSFLKAFLEGRVKRLRVVPAVGHTATRIDMAANK